MELGLCRGETETQRSTFCNAIIIRLSQIFVIALSCVCARYQNSNQSSAQFILIYIFLVLLVWAATLSKEIVWPLRVACYAIPWRITNSNAFSSWSYRTFDGWNTVAFGILFGSVLLATHLYRILLLSQRCMQKEYGTKII